MSVSRLPISQRSGASQSEAVAPGAASASAWCGRMRHQASASAGSVTGGATATVSQPGTARSRSVRQSRRSPGGGAKTGRGAAAPKAAV